MINWKPSIGIALALILSLVSLTGHPEMAGANARLKDTKSRLPDGKLTVRQAAGIAVTRNLQLAIDKLAIDQSKQSSIAAYSDLFPSLTVEYVAYSDKYQNIGQGETLGNQQDARWPFREGFGPGSSLPAMFPLYPYRVDPYRIFEMTATLTQPIYSGGTLLNTYKAAKFDVDSSMVQLQVDKQNLIYNVYQAYYQLLLGEKLLEVAKESIRDLEAVKHQAEEFYKAQVALKVDVLAAEGQLANSKLLLNNAESSISTARSTLNFLLRYPQDTPTGIVQDLKYVPIPYREPAIYSIAAGNRLEIVQADIATQKAKATTKASEGSLGPTVQLEISGTRTNDDWNPFDWEAGNDWSIQGIATWTFNLFRNRATVKANRAAEASSFVNKEYAVEQIMQSVKQAYVAVKKSEADLKDLRKAVEYRKEQYWMNKEQYREQLATYIEVLDGQRQLTLTKGDFYNALMQYKINTAKLEREMGILR
jgi:outer membrane protein TolC